MFSKKSALIVEDEKNISDLLRFHLQKENYNTFQAYSGEEALDLLRKVQPDIILLDIILPETNGLQVCQYLKKNEQYKNIPIIMLTALGEEEDIVKGLELGADDYVTKPFSPRVLKARIKTVERRYSSKDNSNAHQVIQFSSIKLDKEKHKLWIQGEERELTATEFAIIKLLMDKPGVVFTRSKIVNSIRGETHAISDRSIDFQMVGLRRKLKPEEKLIESVRGVGYRFKENV